MKWTNTINNKRAMTTIEITISLALILLFLSMIFPVLRLTLKVENIFLFQEKIERNSSRIIEMLEKEIASSTFGIEEYVGKEELTDGKGIYEISPNKPNIIVFGEEFFSNKKKRGNVLFLEIPFIENGKIYSKYYIYRFISGYFCVYEYSNRVGNLCLEDGETLFEHVDGYFEWDNSGIKIVMNIKREKNYIKELKGYALKGRKREK